MTTDHWHFGRPELAKEYLAAFERGLTSARGLFARRRMGKTEFLKQDLIPAATAAGYLTAYVNLWDNRDNPGEALVAALYVAMQAQGMQKVLERLRTPVKKMKASGKLPGVAEGSFEAELENRKEPPASLLTEAMQKLDTRKKKLLLVIDEAQMLASVPNSSFAHALRASLDIRKRDIKVIFAGSSETTLRSMFARPSEPFYNWAGLEPFPLLGKEFVESMVEKVADISRHPLKPADALAAFEALRNTPEFFRRYLDRYLVNPIEGSDAALAYAKQHIFNSEDFERQWTEMLPADQAILDLVANGATDLYSRESRAALAKALGLEDPVNKSTPQNALTRLTNKNVLTRIEVGRYQFEDATFADWIRHRDQ